MLKASCGSQQPITFMYNGPCAKPTEQGKEKIKRKKTTNTKNDSKQKVKFFALNKFRIAPNSL